MTFCFGHWLSTQAMSDPTWQSDVAKLRPIQKVTDKIQPGPFRCFRWAEPINSSFLYYFFPSILVGYLGQALCFSFFIFGPWPSYNQLIFYFQSSYFGAGPTSQMGPTSHNAIHESHMSEISKLLRLYS